MAASGMRGLAVASGMRGLVVLLSLAGVASIGLHGPGSPLPRAALSSRRLATAMPPGSRGFGFLAGPQKAKGKGAPQPVDVSEDEEEQAPQRVEIPLVPHQVNEVANSLLQGLSGAWGRVKDAAEGSEAASAAGPQVSKVADAVKVNVEGGLRVVTSGLQYARTVVGQAAGRAQAFLDQVRKVQERSGIYYKKGDELVDELMFRARSSLGSAGKAAGDMAKKIPMHKLQLGELEPLWEDTQRFFDVAKPDVVIDSLRSAVPFVDDRLIDVESAWRSFEFEHPSLSEHLVTGGAGSAAYVSSIVVAQRALRSLGVSNMASLGRPASSFGALTIILAGLFAGEAARAASVWRRPRMPKGLAATLPPIQDKRAFSDRVTDVALALFVYKNLLKGSYRSIAPSDLTRPGVFAKEWVPAAGEQYATYGQRVRVGKIGWKRGCHSCGSRLPGGFMGVTKSWVCDHQPPNKLVSMGEDQRFYPHCRACSQLQSLVLRGLRGSLRLHWPPAQAIFGTIFLSVKPSLVLARDSLKRASAVLTGDSTWSEQLLKEKKMRLKQQEQLNKVRPSAVRAKPRTAQKTKPKTAPLPGQSSSAKAKAEQSSAWTFADMVATKPSPKGFDWKTADMLD